MEGRTCAKRRCALRLRGPQANALMRYAAICKLDSKCAAASADSMTSPFGAHSSERRSRRRTTWRALLYVATFRIATFAPWNRFRQLGFAEIRSPIRRWHRKRIQIPVHGRRVEFSYPRHI